jgi:hypothetical protein
MESLPAGETTVAALPIANSHASNDPQEAHHGGTVGLGLKGRLQLAFAAITLLVVIAAGVGFYVFFEVGKSLDQITRKALPPVLAAGELSAKAESGGPALLAANNANEVGRLSDSVLGEPANATQILNQLRQVDIDKAVLDEMRRDPFASE